MTQLTPKDCLYIEDLVHASMLLYKKTQLEAEHLQDETLNKEMTTILETLHSQVQCLLTLMEGATS